MKQKFIVERESDYRPAPVLWHGAQSLMRQAEDNPVGSTWKRMGALLLFAFAVEGYVNTQGPVLFGDEWLKGDKPLQRKPIRDKLKLIGRKHGVAVNFGNSPWKEVDALFDARDQLAHPKPTLAKFGPIEFLCHEEEIDELSQEAFLTDFDRLLRADDLREASAAVKIAIEELNKAIHGEPWSAFINGPTVTTIRDGG